MDKVQTHAAICTKLTNLYERKNHDYGDSFGKGFKEYGMTMPCIRLEDKLNRLKSLLRNEAAVLDESIDDTLMDLANYSIMTLIERHGCADPRENAEKNCRNCRFSTNSPEQAPCDQCYNGNGSDVTKVNWEGM